MKMAVNITARPTLDVVILFTKYSEINHMIKTWTGDVA